MNSLKIVELFERHMIERRHSTDEGYYGDNMPIIQELVLFTVMLIGLLLLGGWFRRNYRSRIFNMLMGWGYVAIPSLISYLFGRMHELVYYSDYLVIWATIVLIGHASSDSINAVNLSNNEDYKDFIMKFLVLASLLGWLILENLSFVDPYMFVISILWVIVFVKVEERARAFWYASKPGVAKITRIFADFMMYEHELSDGGELDPVTLKGYRYLVEVRDLVYYNDPPCYFISIDIDNAVTLEKIWECREVDLLRSNSDHLKDLCLSMSLFWLLLRRFGGYCLYESINAPEKTWKFVQQGLLAGDVTHDQRVFRVIEVELKFLYDLLYTKYYASYVGIWQFRKRFSQLAIIVAFSIVHIWCTNYLYVLSNLDLSTYVVLMIILVVDVVQIVTLLTCEWCKVRWICWYVQKQQWKTKSGRFWGKIIRFLCHVRNQKPWSRKMGQYSLLDSHGYNPCICRLARCCIGNLIDIPRVGQKESSTIKISNEVKQVLIICLREYGQDIHINGISVWQRNRVSHDWLYEGCKLETHTHAILVWHIATSFCEMSYNTSEGQSLTEVKNFKVAKELSMYCAYLVAFAPKLLPDPEETAISIFHEVIDEANELFEMKSCKWSLINCFLSKGQGQEKYEQMIKMGNGSPNIKMGVLIGERLKSKFNMGELWSCLAEFWAEMLLFLAPSNDHMAHAEYLAKGGEFITHLWALLTHAGIIVRRQFVLHPPQAYNHDI